MQLFDQSTLMLALVLVPQCSWSALAFPSLSFPAWPRLWTSSRPPWIFWHTKSYQMEERQRQLSHHAAFPQAWTSLGRTSYWRQWMSGTRGCWEDHQDQRFDQAHHGAKISRGGAVSEPLQALPSLFHRWDRWLSTLGKDNEDYDAEEDVENDEDEDNLPLETDAVCHLGQG